MVRCSKIRLAYIVVGLAAVATVGAANPPPALQPMGGKTRMSLQADVAAAKQELTDKHGARQRVRIARGVEQVASFWQPVDGDASAFRNFVRGHYLADEKQLGALLARLEYTFEQVDGHFNEIGRELRRPTELDIGPMLPVDALLAAFDASAHLVDDLFRSQVAFVVLLNFPLTTLAERLEDGGGWSRDQWAGVRLAGRFARRVPAEVRQEASEAAAASELYISQYNLWMHHVLSPSGERLFPSGKRLISHWNLRDEIKADYQEPHGLEAQRVIAKVMERIVTQTIPLAVVDNPRLDWNPFSNQVTPAPAATVEEGKAGEGALPAVPDGSPEPDTRYAQLLGNFHAARRADPYSPTMPTAIARSFELQREIPEERVKALLTDVLASPLVPRVAALIAQRLGRPLEPHDVWYSGFQTRARYTEKELDALTRRRYPTAAAFAADIPRILTELGFSSERARMLAGHVVVDAARGAGHALPSLRRGDDPHLRTRIEKNGMDYKGFNIAVHELGHNIEQIFSLYEVDHTLLASVPNNAFTEAIAFIFQARDLELLGLAKPDAQSQRLRVLHDFWATWEIAGVALVDVAVWHWLYDHPAAKPAELREAVVRIARETWNRYYAPVLGGDGSVLLGIYSHMISYPLYLPDYPLGHLIAHQIEEHLARRGPLGKELERMTKFGSLTPDLWMTHATGAPVSAAPLLRATEAALAKP